MNEESPILSVAKCRPMFLVSRNIRYMRIFVGVLKGEGANFQMILSVHACVHYFEHEHMFVTYLFLQIV